MPNNPRSSACLRIALLLFAAFLSGCTVRAGLDNDQIIREIAKCRGANLGSKALLNENGETVEIQCTQEGPK